MDSIGQEIAWKHARCEAEWQYIYLTIIEIVKDLRIVPFITAVSAEREREIPYSIARRKNLLGYTGEKGSNIRGNISLKRERFIAKIFNNLVLCKFMWGTGDTDPSPSSKSNQA